MKFLMRRTYYYYLSMTLTSISVPALGQEAGIQVAVCNSDQTAAQYSLSPLSSLPPLEATTIPSNTITLVAPDAWQHNVRLDLCINMDGTIELKQFVTRFSKDGKGTLQARAITRDDGINLTSLEDYIFGENVKDLRLRLPGIESKQYFELQGWDYQGLRFVTWTETLAKDGNVVPQPEVTTGLLVQGNFLQAKELCQSHEHFRKGHYKIQDIDVGLSYCSFRGGGRTMGMRLVELTLNGPSLATPIDLKESELATNNVFFEYYHHNSCDALSIDLAGLKLGMRSVATVTRDDENCTRPFNLAPGREPKQTGESGLLFELEIPGSPKVRGNLPECRHVLECGSDT